MTDEVAAAEAAVAQAEADLKAAEDASKPAETPPAPVEPAPAVVDAEQPDRPAGSSPITEDLQRRWLNDREVVG